ALLPVPGCFRRLCGRPAAARRGRQRGVGRPESDRFGPRQALTSDGVWDLHLLGPGPPWPAVRLAADRRREGRPPGTCRLAEAVLPALLEPGRDLCDQCILAEAPDDLDPNRQAVDW